MIDMALHRRGRALDLNTHRSCNISNTTIGCDWFDGRELLQAHSVSDMQLEKCIVQVMQFLKTAYGVASTLTRAKANEQSTLDDVFTYSREMKAKDALGELT